MSITKLIACPTCGYPLDETEQKGLATLTEGMVLVPREPTEAMCDAGGEWMYNEYPSLEFNDSHSIYKAMLSIAEESK